MPAKPLCGSHLQACLIRSVCKAQTEQHVVCTLEQTAEADCMCRWSAAAMACRRCVAAPEGSTGVCSPGLHRCLLEQTGEPSSSTRLGPGLNIMTVAWLPEAACQRWHTSCSTAAHHGNVRACLRSILAGAAALEAHSSSQGMQPAGCTQPHQQEAAAADSMQPQRLGRGHPPQQHAAPQGGRASDGTVPAVPGLRLCRVARLDAVQGIQRPQGRCCCGAAVQWQPGRRLPHLAGAGRVAPDCSVQDAGMVEPQPAVCAASGCSPQSTAGIGKMLKADFDRLAPA